MSSDPTIRIRQVENYVFTIDFADAIPALTSDEAPPIGEGRGPFPEQLLVTGVANCLCASLVFALGKFRQDGRGVEAEARCRVARNAEGRLRIFEIDVTIALGAAAGDMPRIDRVIEQFQRFCTVSESVKVGIPVAVTVRDRDGILLG